MSMARDAGEANDTCCNLWHLFNERKWDEARTLLSEDFECDWPQSRERIIGPDNFIEVNRRYPGEHKIEVLNSMVQYDAWELASTVSTQVYIESLMPNGDVIKFYGLSYFELDHDGFIKSATEFWAEISEPPLWRKDLVQRY